MGPKPKRRAPLQHQDDARRTQSKGAEAEARDPGRHGGPRKGQAIKEGKDPEAGGQDESEGRKKSQGKNRQPNERGRTDGRGARQA